MERLRGEPDEEGAKFHRLDALRRVLAGELRKQFQVGVLADPDREDERIASGFRLAGRGGGSAPVIGRNTVGDEHLDRDPMPDAVLAIALGDAGGERQRIDNRRPKRRGAVRGQGLRVIGDRITDFGHDPDLVPPAEANLGDLDLEGGLLVGVQRRGEAAAAAVEQVDLRLRGSGGAIQHGGRKIEPQHQGQALVAILTKRQVGDLHVGGSPVGCRLPPVRRRWPAGSSVA